MLDRRERAGAWREIRPQLDIWESSERWDHTQTRLRALKRDPLMPRGVADALGKYLIALSGSSSDLREALDEAGDEIAGRYPTAESLLEANTGWIHEKWASKRKDDRSILSARNAVLTAVRKHLQPDEAGLPQRG